MDLEKEAYALLARNRRETDGHLYTVPSPDTYPYQWLWDSCFHAIVLSKTEPEAAKAELRSLVSRQFENGMLPHMIYWQPGALYEYELEERGTSALMNDETGFTLDWVTDALRELVAHRYMPVVARGALGDDSVLYGATNL